MRTSRRARGQDRRGTEEEVEEDKIIEDEQTEEDYTVYSYQHTGSDTVDDVKTQVAVFHEDGEEIKLWMDESGDVVQIELDGEIPEDMGIWH